MAQSTENLAPSSDVGASSEPDLEAGKPETQSPTNSTCIPASDQHQHHDNMTNPKPSADPDLVTWDGPDDPENPKNWPKAHKWTYTCTVSLFVFISPVSSAMIAPAMAKLGAGLAMRTEFEVYLSLAIFILAYAVGPVFFGPASELYGRVYLLQASNLWYLAWNLGCGFAGSKAQFFAFRFLAGIGASAPLALGGGAISDVWNKDERGKAIGLYTLGPMLGPVIGPIAGGFIAEYTTWRWVFYSTSIAAVAVQALGLLFLRESHPGTLLRRKRDRLITQTNNPNLHTAEPPSSLPSKLVHALVRPIRMFTTQPIVACMSIYMAYLFGTTFLMFATFPEIWTAWYAESHDMGGLNYLAIALGSFTGLFLSIGLADRVYRRLKSANNDTSEPEMRIPGMAAGSVLVTAGLFWYGWSIQAHAHWVMPDLGALVFTAGTMLCLQGMQGYIVDSYETYAASALAAVAILRSLAGFAFPLFAPYLYRALGYGWGTSVLGFVRYLRKSL
ncbi:major facilitator superfamily domain-containing protein [Podospora appendiculata]|uniref:Major facilitator superfamily domain-containing protein n=1 Tax=Podospora appendiculata TaxID=314037 RepID=A0AAE0X7J0_9PEZI|nr:major facilitator superfamily domain-containing protein [Podospora appendiculata]